MLRAFPIDGFLPGVPQLHHHPATAADADWIAELRADVLRESLERLGRYDPERVRTRFLSSFRAPETSVFLYEDQPVGSLALGSANGSAEDGGPENRGTWVEHFYLASVIQGRGVGSALLSLLTARADALGEVLCLNVLRFSPAQRLYARHGFVVDSADEVDMYMSRLAAVSG